VAVKKFSDGQEPEEVVTKSGKVLIGGQTLVFIFCILQQREQVPQTPLVSIQVLKEEKDCWDDMQASNSHLPSVSLLRCCVCLITHLLI